MIKVKAYERNNKLYNEEVEGSVEVTAYRADGRLFKTEKEAENVDADWDLKHFISRIGLLGPEKEEVIDFIKLNKRELLNILVRM